MTYQRRRSLCIAHLHTDMKVLVNNIIVQFLFVDSVIFKILNLFKAVLDEKT